MYEMQASHTWDTDEIIFLDKGGNDLFFEEMGLMFFVAYGPENEFSFIFICYNV